MTSDNCFDFSNLLQVWEESHASTETLPLFWKSNLGYRAVPTYSLWFRKGPAWCMHLNYMHSIILRFSADSYTSRKSFKSKSTCTKKKQQSLTRWEWISPLKFIGKIRSNAQGCPRYMWKTFFKSASVSKAILGQRRNMSGGKLSTKHQYEGGSKCLAVWCNQSIPSFLKQVWKRKSAAHSWNSWWVFCLLGAVNLLAAIFVSADFCLHELHKPWTKSPRI